MSESAENAIVRPRPEAPLWTSTTPQPGRPVLIAGLAANAVMNGSGEFELSREARGGPSEWGGVYGQDVRLTGPWTVRWRIGGSERTIPETLRQVSAWRWGLESVHEDHGVRIRQEVAAFERVPGVCRTLYFQNRSSSPVTLDVQSSLEPFLTPVILEGVKPYKYRALCEAGTVEVSAHGSAFLLDTDPIPTGMALNGEDWTGKSLEGEYSNLKLRHTVLLDPGGAARLRWAISGGTHRWTAANPSEGKEQLLRPLSPLSDARERWLSWRAGTPEFSCPDPTLTEGYRLARDALRCLYTDPDPGFTGLVAGYPWYSTMWCRDLAWALPAVLWLGDHEWAASSLETVFRFQARVRIAILSAEAGELPVEVCPGPIFLFGTSDTTLYYPGLVRRLWNLAGDRRRIEAWSPVLDRIAGWAEGRYVPDPGLLRNGGEVEGLKDAGASLGRVHFGIDAEDTTIWDSADRRDHAIDIQCLGFEAFDSLGDLSESLGQSESARLHRARASSIADAVRARYTWRDEAYLYDSLRTDGSPVAHVRPNALRTVSAGIVRDELARALVDRASQPDLSTPWGVRTLSSKDSDFDPIGYHQGQVWTIATAWAADAALQAGERAGGLDFLRVNAQRIIDEFGLANECYRGDRPEPFNSCFLLGFSVGPFLSTIFDSLWGLAPDASRGRIGCRPRFPADWDHAELTGVRLGPGRLSLRYVPGHLEVRWDGPEPLTVAGDHGEVTVSANAPADLALPSPEKA